MLKIKNVSRLLLFILCVLTFSSYSQKNLASPRDSVSGQVFGVTLSINYGSPAVKGRVIWGKLVPYGQVWRAGANEATRLKINQPLKIQGKLVPAGEYGLFAIPGEKQWTIIINKVANQWGAFEYNMKEDVIRVTVTPEYKEEKQEHLKYQIKETKFYILWDTISVPISLEAAK